MGRISKLQKSRLDRLKQGNEVNPNHANRGTKLRSGKVALKLKIKQTKKPKPPKNNIGDQLDEMRVKSIATSMKKKKLIKQKVAAMNAAKAKISASLKEVGLLIFYLSLITMIF